MANSETTLFSPSKTDQSDVYIGKFAPLVYVRWFEAIQFN